MSAKSLNFCQELGASVCEHHPNLREDEGNLIVDGRLLRMVWELLAEQAPASGQQGGTGEGGAVHEAPSAEGVGGGAVAPTIDTGMIRTSCDQFKFGVEHISVTPLLEGRHDLTAWVSATRPQLQKGDDETAESYCNRTRTIRAELLTIGQEVHMATFAAHMLKGVKGKEGKGGREQMDKKKGGKWEKKRAPFKGRCYNCKEEGHMAAKCPNKKKDTTPAAAANVTEGDEKGASLTVACSAAKLLADKKLMDEGENLQAEEGVIRIIASGGQVAAMARYRHRLLCPDLKPWPASNGTTAAAACNGTMACNGTTTGATCNNTMAAAARNGTLAAAAVVTCDGMSKAIADVASGEPKEHDEAASLTAYSVGTEAMLSLWHTHLENDHAGAVKWTATNGGGEQPFDRSVDPAGSKGTMAPPPLCPFLAAGLAPVGPEVGPSADERRAADEDREGEATDLKSAATHGKDPIPTLPPLQPTPPPPYHSSRPNKGVPPVRFQPSAMTALDADDEDNPYDVAYPAKDDCDTDSDDEVEYPNDDEEEEDT
ncbi:unnamed protein product [Closterium sp. NIES-65]|nr:unnamed protein product [Closterium sp. NIES-65]